MTRIFLVDDHELVRRGLKELLGQEPDLEVCGEAADARTALDALEDARADIVVIDLSLEEGDGLDLIKQIRARDQKIRILVLSMRDEKLYAERALRAGASGYVHKQEPAEQVVAAIRSVLAGRVHLSRHMADHVLQRLVRLGNERPPVDTLSDRELQVLDLMGDGLTTQEIALQLHLSPKTVHTYRDKVKSKLQLRSAFELFRYAIARKLE